MIHASGYVSYFDDRIGICILLWGRRIVTPLKHRELLNWWPINECNFPWFPFQIGSPTEVIIVFTSMRQTSQLATLMWKQLVKVSLVIYLWYACYGMIREWNNDLGNRYLPKLDPPCCNSLFPDKRRNGCHFADIL